ncbi:MAG: metalloprotease PmbA, partial [Gammaproteobacteria bacterium]|nr:metalloprotease PmbA [Gammaproteobacteria bacterium]
MNQLARKTEPEQDLNQLLHHAADVVLSEAKRQGATQCELSGYCHHGLSVTVRLGELETIEHENDRHFGVSVYFGHALGSASTNDLSDTSLVSIVDKACSMAKFTAEDPASGLADADRLARQRPELDLNHPWAIDAYQATDLAIECEQAGRDVDARITNSEGATVTTGQSITIYANSHDFIAGFEKTRHSIVCSLLAEEDGQMATNYWYDEARNHDLMAAGADIGHQA